MELDVGAQALGLSLAFVQGAAMGALYDMLRPLRRRCGSGGAAALDVLYMLACGALAFLFAMGAGSGKLGVWELAATLAGFAGYMYTLSALVFPLLDRTAGAISRRGEKVKRQIKKTIGKIADFTKFLFHKVRE